MPPTGWLICYCGYEIEVNSNDYVIKCPNCGRKFIYKNRSEKFVLKEGPPGWVKV